MTFGVWLHKPSSAQFRKQSTEHIPKHPKIPNTPPTDIKNYHLLPPNSPSSVTDSFPGPPEQNPTALHLFFPTNNKRNQLNRGETVAGAPPPAIEPVALGLLLFGGGGHRCPGGRERRRRRRVGRESGIHV